MDYLEFAMKSADTHGFERKRPENAYPQVCMQVASYVYYLESRHNVDFARRIKDDGQRCREQECAAAVSRLERALRGLEV